MSKITNADIFAINHQDDVDSYPLRTNYTNIKNRHNELVDTVDAASIGTTNAETTAARPYHTAIKNRLDSIQLNQENYVKDGFMVSVNGSDSAKLNISAGRATAGGIEVEKGYATWTRSGATITVTENGHGRSNADEIAVDVCSDENSIPLGEYTVGGSATNTYTFTGVAAGAASGTLECSTITATLAAPTTMRYDVVVINSDNSITVLGGNDSADRVLPAVASTQRPLSIVDYDSSTVPVLVDGDLTDCATQGCVTDYGWYWTITAAIASFNDRTNSTNQGTVTIRKGLYYEEADISGISNITLWYEGGAKHYRPSDTEYCIKSDNGSGTETTGIRIYNGDYYGNSKAGAIPLLFFDYTDDSYLENITMDANTSSTANAKRLQITNCDRMYRDGKLTFNDLTISTGTTLYQLRYKVHNLIISDAITIDCTSTTAPYPLSREWIFFDCQGEYHAISGATFTRAAAQTINNNGNDGSNGNGATGGAGGIVGLDSSMITNLAGGDGGTGDNGAAGADARGGGGGGGAGSILVAGGAGGNAETGGGAGAAIGTGGDNGVICPSLIIVAENIEIKDDITLLGFAGNNGAGATAGGGGGGGTAGGNVILFAKDSIDINCTITNSGGAGGNGANGTHADGGGGGGGAGGNVVMRYLTITDNLTHTSTGGAGGTSVGGSNGSAGGAGVTNQEIYNALAADISGSWILGEII